VYFIYLIFIVGSAQLRAHPIDDPVNYLCENPNVEDVPDSGISITIISRDPFCDTGIQLKSGYSYTFHVEHISQDWADGKDRRLSFKYGQMDERGWTVSWLPIYLRGVYLAQPFRPCRLGHWFELVGVVHSANNEPITFRLGEGIKKRRELHYEGTDEAHLHVYANDLSSRYFNNHGSMKIKVQQSKESKDREFTEFLLCQ